MVVFVGHAKPRSSTIRDQLGPGHLGPSHRFCMMNWKMHTAARLRDHMSKLQTLCHQEPQQSADFSNHLSHSSTGRSCSLYIRGFRMVQDCSSKGTSRASTWRFVMQATLLWHHQILIQISLSNQDYTISQLVSLGKSSFGLTKLLPLSGKDAILKMRKAKNAVVSCPNPATVLHLSPDTSFSSHKAVNC